MLAAIQSSGTRLPFLPSPFVSFLSFSFFLLSLSNSSPCPSSLSFTPSSSSSVSSNLFSSSRHITFLSSHLPSLSFRFTFILLKNSSFALSSLILCYSVLSLALFPNSPFPPSCPFSNSSIFLLSSSFSPPLQIAALISSAETLSSHLSGQGSTTAHFTHDRVCCMPVMYVCC